MEYQELFMLFVMGAVAILIIMFTIMAGIVMAGVSVKAWRIFVAVDSELAKFGRTSTGQYLYTQASQLFPYVDNPDDKVVQMALTLPLLKQLHQKKMLTAEALSKWLVDGLELVTEALDGIPISEKVPPAEDMG